MKSFIAFKPLVGSLCALSLILTGCQGRGVVGQLKVAALPTASEAARLTATVAPAKTSYQTQYLRALDWETAEATLSRNGAPVQVETVTAVVDPQTKARTASVAFSSLAPGSGYALTVRLLRRDPAGAALEVGRAEQPSFSLNKGANTLDLPAVTPQDATAPVPQALVLTSGTVGSWPASGPGGRLSTPWGIARTPDGTTFLMEAGSNCVRRLSPDGTLSVYAGTGVAGYADGPAATAQFSGAEGIACADDGTLYIADGANHRIRKIDPDGNVTTLAGDGSGFYVDGPGATAAFLNPAGIVVAPDGMLYVADTGNRRIRTVAPDGTVGTLAGSGAAGDADGPAATATFEAPRGLARAADGTLYIADSTGHRIRRVADGIVSTVAGDGVPGAVDGPGATARFSSPAGVAVADDGTLYIADLANARIRTVSPEGMVATLAGSVVGFKDGSGADARFANPRGLSLAPDGTLFVLDPSNQRLRAVAPDGSVSTVIGDETGGVTDGPYISQGYNAPMALAPGPGGVMYVAERNRVRLVTPEGVITTVAGDRAAGFADGSPTEARFSSLAGIARAADGSLYVADGNNQRIRKIAPDGTVTTLAGDGTAGFISGPGASARFNGPNQLALGPDGTVYVTDEQNHAIRFVAPDGMVGTLVGGAAGYVDGGSAVAQFNQPTGLAMGPDGALYVADSLNHRIRRVTTLGTVTTFAGEGSEGFLDGPVVSARFSSPRGLTVAPDGTVYVSDTDNRRLRKIDPGGVVSAIAGDGQSGYMDGAARAARFSSLRGLALDDDGLLYIADVNNHWIRRFKP